MTLSLIVLTSLRFTPNSDCYNW